MFASIRNGAIGGRNGHFGTLLTVCRQLHLPFDVGFGVVISEDASDFNPSTIDFFPVNLDLQQASNELSGFPAGVCAIVRRITALMFGVRICTILNQQFDDFGVPEKGGAVQCRTGISIPRVDIRPLLY